MRVSGLMITSIIFDANVQAKRRFLHESRTGIQVITTCIGKDAFSTLTSRLQLSLALQ